MTDIALAFADDALVADIALIGGDLATDDGLRTAVIISLFTDAQAAADDTLPQEGGDRRGWWGDVGNEPNDRTGSRLWLLERAKATDAVAIRAREYAREALAWMIADGIAASIAVTATVYRPTAVAPQGALLLAVTIARPTGVRVAIELLWDAEANRLLSTRTVS
ncbi:MULTISPECIES: phage GP46 family protein [unclassified Sphingobium]|uniref:phage GP46 family protein n=1 Tax=unclassified Sphingobium TaxID=2611147 RepID=UPI0035A6F5D6